MIVDLREFEDFPVQTTVAAGPGELTPVADSIKEIQRAEILLAIQKAGEEFFCQGQVHATVTLECARCLRHYTAELRNTADFVICSEVLAAERAQEGIDDEDYVYLRGMDLRVDITEPVRQAVELAVPMMPLCTADCRGICPRCGANRNEQPCDCETKETDPRWDGLRGLLDGE